MKNYITKLLLCTGLLAAQPVLAGNVWQQVDPSAAPARLQVMHPSNFKVFRLDEATLKLQLWNVSSDPAEAIVLSLPMPDGSYRDFRVWESGMMPPLLAAKYPGIRSFTGVAVSNAAVTAKLDFTLFGFDAMIYDGDNTSFIDPYDNYSDGYYMVHYKRDETRTATSMMRCAVNAERDYPSAATAVNVPAATAHKAAAKTLNGTTLRTYVLALAADHYYCQAATGLPSPTIGQAFSKMTVTMNRINGVYNREFSVQMNFCANEDTLIWTTLSGGINGTDPFDTINSLPVSCMTQNQLQCTNRIGSANYDLGHVFTTGGGGQSSLGVVCNNTQKAKSVTGSPTPVGDGYDIDYVAHEMGHEFGANHTFNDNTSGNCAGNRAGSVAYEPGSGSTIMAYAGICSPDDLAPHSDAYFHAASLSEIVTKLNGSENACATATATGNKTVGLAAFSTSYTIPYKTPFELTAPVAVDSVADTSTTYCWEQWNKSSSGTLVGTFVTGPIFRSYNPTTTTTRIFPKNSLVLSGILSNAGIENNQGEKAPDTARYLTFRLTVRAIINGNGSVTFPDDTVHINAISTGAAANYAGFRVTSQNTTGVTYAPSSTQAVTWDVAGTDAAPVSADSVTIYMSRDGGNTWVDNLGTFPNTGSATVLLPAVTTALARIKVKAVHNVFFNVNSKNFTVSTGSASHTGVSAVSPAADVKVYPNPASDVLHMAMGTGSCNAVIYNTLGEIMYSGAVSGHVSIQVGNWARGMYFVHIAGQGNDDYAVRPVVLQ